MSQFVTKKIEAFAVHAHRANGAVNYRLLFERLEGIQKRRRILELGDKLIALPVVRVTGSECFLIAYEGPIGLKPLIFNSGNAEERIEQLQPQEVVATRTHGLIKLASRELYLEFNQRGAKATHIQELISAVVSQSDGWEGLDLAFTPMVDQDFMDAVDRFARVRIASVKLARPNVDWTDDFKHYMAIAQESDAGTFEVAAYAERGGSLSKRRGLIDFIKNVTAHELPSVTAAHITGNRQGEEAETTVSLSKFIRHRRVRVPVDDDGHVITTEMRDRLLEFAEERTRERRGR